MTRFLHTADWQLGMTRHFLDEDAQARFDAARIDVIREIARVADERECAFVIVAGDVFDSNQVDRRTVARACEALRTFSMPVLLLPGNHDALDASSVYRSAAFTSAFPDGVAVLTDETPIEIVPGVEVVGVPWTTRRPVRDLVAAACAELGPATGSTRVMAAHGGVDAVVFDTGDPALIRLESAEAALAEERIHYLALGDRHSVTEAGTTGRIGYSGAPEPTSYREDRPGHVVIVDVDAASVSTEAVRVGRWRFVDVQLELASDDDVERLRAELDALDDKDRTIVRIALVGSLTLSGKTRLDALLAEARDLFAAVQEWARHTDLTVIPADSDFATLELAGFAQEAVLDLRAHAEGGDATARDALALLVRLAGSDVASGT